jgi:hypothetical protein
MRLRADGIGHETIMRIGDLVQVNRPSRTASYSGRNSFLLALGQNILQGWLFSLVVLDRLHSGRQSHRLVLFCIR